MPSAAPRLCSHCNAARPVLKRPKNHDQLCKECFYWVFEEEVHQTIVSQRLFRPGERVALAASGGKDSTVLAHVVTTLNKRCNYGLDLFLLSIDEGISGYRDDSLETVKRNEETYGIPLVVISYKQLYDWTMDEIVAQIGTKNNCTFCGVFRRQALDRGAVIAKADKIATGHNADDMAETVLLNILRGDIARLGRCASAITGEDGQGLPRVKPFKYTYEKEIVMYAYYKKLDYFSTECVYAPFAARGFARDFVKDLEAVRPASILDIIRSAEHFAVALGQGPANPSTHDQTCSTPAAKPNGTHALADQLSASVGQLPESSPAQGKSNDESCSAVSQRQGEMVETNNTTLQNGSEGLAQASIQQNQPPSAFAYLQSTHAGGKPITRDVSGAPVVGLRNSQGLTGSDNPNGTVTGPKLCQRCGYLTSQPICKACTLLEGLNKGRAGHQIKLQAPLPASPAQAFDAAPSNFATGRGQQVQGTSNGSNQFVGVVAHPSASHNDTSSQPTHVNGNHECQEDKNARLQHTDTGNGLGKGQAASLESRKPSQTRRVVIEYEAGG